MFQLSWAIPPVSSSFRLVQYSDNFSILGSWDYFYLCSSTRIALWWVSLFQPHFYTWFCPSGSPPVAPLLWHSLPKLSGLTIDSLLSQRGLPASATCMCWERRWSGRLNSRSSSTWGSLKHLGLKNASPGCGNRVPVQLRSTSQLWPCPWNYTPLPSEASVLMMGGLMTLGLFSHFLDGRHLDPF